MAKRAPSIRDRVKELVRVRAGDLVEHPGNWRTHPKAQLDNEWATRRMPVNIALHVIQELAKRIFMDDARLLHQKWLAGTINAVNEAHDRDPDAKVPVLVLDVTAAEADKLLATMDPISAMAGRNQDALADLLAKVKTEDEALKRMLADLGGPPQLTEGG